MDMTRKTMGVLLAILGAYYCVLSVRTLATLSSVTTTWIQRSGDSDFRLEYGNFMMWIAVGAILVGAFGYRTVVKGIRAVRGQRESWLALAIAAPLLHWFWFLFRTIGNGILDRESQAIGMRNNALRFAAICLAYLVMSILMRRGEAARRPTASRMHATTALGR